MKRIEEVTLTIDDKEKDFEIYVGAYEFIHFEEEIERLTGKKGTFLDMMTQAQQGSMKAIILLLGSALHHKNKMKPVGVDYLNKIDVMEHLQTLMGALGRSMTSNQVKPENNEGK